MLYLSHSAQVPPSTRAGGEPQAGRSTANSFEAYGQPARRILWRARLLGSPGAGA